MPSHAAAAPPTGGALSQNRMCGSVAQNNPFKPTSSQRELSENLHPEQKPSECARPRARRQRLTRLGATPGPGRASTMNDLASF